MNALKNTLFRLGIEPKVINDALNELVFIKVAAVPSFTGVIPPVEGAGATTPAETKSETPIEVVLDRESIGACMKVFEDAKVTEDLRANAELEIKMGLLNEFVCTDDAECGMLLTILQLKGLPITIVNDCKKLLNINKDEVIPNPELLSAAPQALAKWCLNDNLDKLSYLQPAFNHLMDIAANVKISDAE